MRRWLRRWGIREEEERRREGGVWLVGWGWSYFGRGGGGGEKSVCV